MAGHQCQRKPSNKLKRYFPNAYLQNAYGATETYLTCNNHAAVYNQNKIVSVGLPVPVGD